MEAKIITICNKLNRTDSQTGLDIWYKHNLKDITYAIERIMTVNGTQTSIGQVFTILIPFDSGYLPYNRWKDDTDKINHFTLSQGDYIFLEELVEEVNASNIVSLKNSKKPNVCEVRSIIEVPKRNGVNIQLKVSGI